MIFQIIQHEASGYNQRTKANAEAADLTVAFNVNPKTGGSRCTQKYAKERYLGIDLNKHWKAGARLLWVACRHFDVKTLNIAGNGMSTLADHGWTQDEVAEYVFTVVETVHNHWPIQKIVTGGQTGADIAGAAAGYALQIPTVVTLPRGYLQRDEHGVDHRQTRDIIWGQIEALAEFAGCRGVRE